jgi:hypothetical protein
MSFNKHIIKELNNIYQLTHNLYITKLNENNTDIDSIINFLQSQIYNGNHLKFQLNESLQHLKKIKQSICNLINLNVIILIMNQCKLYVLIVINYLTDIYFINFNLLFNLLFNLIIYIFQYY